MPLNITEKVGWTGGQYSLYRTTLGLYMLMYFLQLLPWGTELFSNHGVLPEAETSPLAIPGVNILSFADSPTMVAAMLMIGVVASVALAVGKLDRVATIVLWYIWACLLGRNPLILNPGLPYVGWLLVAHAFLPPAPYGSWSARRRADPGHGWAMPGSIFFIAWFLMACGYSYAGYTKLISPSWIDGSAIEKILDSPLVRPAMLREAVLNLPNPVLWLMSWSGLGFELAFAPLALFRRLRPWLWLAAVLMHLGLGLLLDFANLTTGMLLMHFFTFNPIWLTSTRANTVQTIFYDGHCGFCHRWIRFVIAEDTDGSRFRFSPLQGNLIHKTLPTAYIESLLNSIIVMDTDGTPLTRSAAVMHILWHLGGLWRVLCWSGRAIPQPLRDRIYDSVAACRHRLFLAPEDTCPLLPPKLRQRFCD